MSEKNSNGIDEKILNNIKERLNPDLKVILLKIFIIHLLTAIVTLSICPQYGIQFFKTSFNLMPIFMKLGNHFCDFVCGTFFTATSFFTALFIISRDELRVLRFHKNLTIGLIILSSIGFFLIMAPPLFFEFSLLWILGAVIGSYLTVELGVKFQLSQSKFL